MATYSEDDRPSASRHGSFCWARVTSCFLILRYASPPMRLASSLHFQNTSCLSRGNFRPPAMATTADAGVPRYTVYRPKTMQPSTYRHEATGSELNRTLMPASAAASATLLE